MSLAQRLSKGKRNEHTTSKASGYDRAVAGTVA